LPSFAGDRLHLPFEFDQTRGLLDACVQSFCARSLQRWGRCRPLPLRRLLVPRRRVPAAGRTRSDPILTGHRWPSGLPRQSGRGGPCRFSGWRDGLEGPVLGITTTQTTPRAESSGSEPCCSQCRRPATDPALQLVAAGLCAPYGKRTPEFGMGQTASARCGSIRRGDIELSEANLTALEIELCISDTLPARFLSSIVQKAG